MIPIYDAFPIIGILALGCIVAYLNWADRDKEVDRLRKEVDRLNTQLNEDRKSGRDLAFERAEARIAVLEKVVSNKSVTVDKRFNPREG